MEIRVRDKRADLDEIKKIGKRINDESRNIKNCLIPEYL